MKIRAIRLREVGCFSAPVALEGLSGALDVLAGPNELGKSTILRALQLLFTARHTAQSRNIERLRPYAGGTPLIEADFEIEGQLWRLRKQFLSERQAVLTDLTSGRVAARGEEAHHRATELIGNGGEHRLGLLWLDQRMSLEPAVPKDPARQQLSALIEREIAAAASGGHDLRLMREKIMQQRRALVTDHRPPRPAGEYASAIAACNAVEQNLQEARDRARAASSRVSSAERLRQRRATLTDPALVGARRERLRQLKSDHETAVAARQQLKIVDANVTACESRLGEAQQACEAFGRLVAEAHELETAAAASATTERELTEMLRQLGDALDSARARREELRARLETERQRMRARQKLESRREAVARFEALSARLAEARSAAQLAAELRARLRREGVTEARIIAAEREAGAIATLESRIAAQLPKVRIAYVAGAADRISVHGRSLGDGEVLTPAHPISLVIEGIGTITIDPAVSENIEEDQADLDAHRAELADLLAAMGVPDLSAARERLAERQRLEREIAQAEDRIATRAPEGLNALDQELQRLGALNEPTSADEADLPELPVLEAEVERLGTSVLEAEETADRLGQDHARTRERLAHITAAASARAKRLAALAGMLPPSEERAARLATLEATLETTRAAASEAIRERTAWREKAPDDARMRELEAALRDAQQQERSTAEELARVERDLAVLERELERDQQDGIATEIAELEEKHQSLREQVQRFQRELEALNLLLETLTQVEQQSRDLHLSPVLDRLNPYMDLVFPGARVGIGQNFGAEAVVRGAVSEQVSALSDGTQEQIAVLVRLAFARLLADAGRPTPLILDDALVYSDDTRIEKLFGALRQAAGAHQVIVFTCRSRTFEHLGGRRLDLAPWAVQ